MFYRQRLTLPAGTLFVWLAVCPIVAQEGPLKIGTITDGPWNRNQLILATYEKEVSEALAGRREVRFAEDKQLNGDWTSKGARAALNQLLSDPDVDLILTLGLVTSYEATTRRDLAKPVIATRVIAPDLLKVPSGQVGSKRVSGIPNLSYITVEGVDLMQKMRTFRQIVPFSRLTFLMLESLRDLLPAVEAEIATHLAPMNLSGVDVIFVGESYGPALAAMPEGVQAVVLTPLPQMEAGEYGRLLETLIDMGLPTFTLGSRQEVAAGVMAGITAPHETETLAKRIASNIRAIVDGQQAADLAVSLPLQETLLINSQVASALGVDVAEGPMAKAQVTSGEEADEANPSMAAVSEEDPDAPAGPGQSEEARRLQERIIQEVRKRILRLSSYTAFDVLNFSIAGNKVTLLGYAYRRVLSRDAERTVSRIEGVEVENRIEVLPNSGFDDRIRLRAYAAIYGHPQLRRYSRGGGFSRFDVQRAASDLRFGIDAVQEVKGPHPIHIVVKNGNVALVGIVNSRVHSQIAEMQVRQLSGIFSVENHLQVVKGR